MQLESNSSAISVRLMGGLEVLDSHGQRLDVALRLRWLLARLVLDPRPVPRSLLAQTFWSKGGTQSLRQALYSLKSLPGADRWLEVSKDSVRVLLSCDARRFEALVAARAYDEALEVGPLLLFGDASFERTEELSLWIDEQRERFEQSVRAALLGAARECIARGSLDRALRYVDEGLARDPLDEGLAREGMNVCAAMGAHGAALDRYESLRRGLLSKLGVEPTEQTDQLADTLARVSQRALAPARERGPWVLDARAPHDERAKAYACARRWLGAERFAPILAAAAQDSASVVRAPLGEAALRWSVTEALAQRADGALVVLDALHEVDPQSALALLDGARHGALRLAVYGRIDALDPAVRAALDQTVAQRALAPIVASRAPEDASDTAARVAPAEAWESLSRDARRVAQWLAIEPDADDALLCAVLALDAPACEAALAALDGAAVLDGRAWRSAEASALVRATVSESVARGWSRTAALVFEARGEHERASRHFLACGEGARAVRGAIAAAERCCALFATREASALLDAVQEAAVDAADRFAIASIRERVAMIDAEHEARERWLRAMRESAAELQRDEAMVEAQLRAIARLRERGLYAEALAESEACARECDRAALLAQGLRARAERAIALLRTGSMDEAERAFEQLASATDPAAVAVGEYGLGAVRGYRLDLDGARAMHERVLTAARSRGDLGVVVRALNGLAATAERAGQRRQAAGRFEESALLARRIRDHEGARMAEVNAALAWTFGGRPARALALLDAERPEERALLRPRALEAQTRAELWLGLGRFSLARAAFDQCVTLAEQGHDRRRAAHAMLDRAFCEDDWRRCEQTVRAVLDREREHTQDVASLSWLELALVAPDAGSVRALLAQAGEALGPVASLLAMMARLRVGEDAGAALDQALDERETMFSLLGLRLLCTHREGAARSEAERRFERAWSEASEGLSTEHARRWRAWIDARASRSLDACWTWSERAER